MRRLALVLALVVTVGCTQTPPPADEDLPSVDEAREDEIAVVAEDLDTVWEIAFGPEGRLFYTERPGTIGVAGNGTWRAMSETVEHGEGGLMGLALHPDFANESYVYACQTHRDDEGELANRVVRVRETEDGTGEPQPIVEGLDASRFHNGCRLAFGPEGLLYVTMGDASESDVAQDEGARNGKVLRYTPEGEPAGADEAGWHPAVFTMGHRNPQGLDFHPETGTPYISEHGPENHDEINVLEPGANYGWPEARGTDTGGGPFEPAIWTSGEQGTVAPAGAAFVDAPNSSLHEALLVATLADAQLHVFEIAGENGRGEPVVEAEHVFFEERFGRLRAATWGPDDALYLGTSNEDPRGTAGPSDDRILRVPLSVLEDEIAG